MCTSINYVNGDHYFGRNLDLEIDYPVDAVITPRNFECKFRHAGVCANHPAFVGMGMIVENTPLYFEAVNEKGLGVAGLAFFGEATYFPPVEGKTNVASFEFIPYILSHCNSVEEAKEELKNMNITNESFSPQMPYSELHWQIGDKNSTIVVESTKEYGLRVYDNPFGVLTNCPGFDYQKVNVSYYLNSTGSTVDIRFAPDKKGLDLFSRGMGSIGIPGGVDSVSRFVRVAFSKLNSFCEKTEDKNVSEVFHLFQSVAQLNGEAEVTPGQYEITQYTAFGNTDKGIYYFTTYYNQNISAVDMNKENLDGNALIAYKVPKELKINTLN